VPEIQEKSIITPAYVRAHWSDIPINSCQANQISVFDRFNVCHPKQINGGLWLKLYG